MNVAAGQTSTQDATLPQAAFSLSEVVVTVTGAQKKAEIANTVASVDIAAKAQETTANSLGQLLSGQAAGVQIISAGAAGGGSESASAANRRCRSATRRSCTSTASR